MEPSVNPTDVRVKLKAIAYYKTVGNKALTAKMFGVSDKTVAKWIKNERRLRAEAPSNIRRSHADSVSLLEWCLLYFVNDRHRHGHTVEYEELAEHAACLKKVHKVRGLPVTRQWITEFVTRQRLRSKCGSLRRFPTRHVAGATKSRAPAKSRAKKQEVRSAVKKAANKCLKVALNRTNKAVTKKAGLAINALKKKAKSVMEKKKPQRNSSAQKPNIQKVLALSKKIFTKAKTRKDDKQKLIPRNTTKTTLTKRSKTEMARKPKNVTKPKVTVTAAKQSLKRAKLLARRTKQSSVSTASRVTTAQRLRSAKQMERRRQPTKIFRTRYRIKEMQRRIEENRASDFFDFFYGLGLIPVSKDPSDSWCYPLLERDQRSPRSSYSSASDTLSSSSLNVPQSPSSPQTRRYLAWRPRATLVTSPLKDSGLIQWIPGEIAKQEPGPSNLEDTSMLQLSLLQQTKTFFESIQSGSLQSENAESPGESPITPEQLAGVKQLFPDSGQLKVFSAEKSPPKLSPIKMDRPCLNLRPRTTEQLERLAGCFGSLRKRKAETPPPPKLSSGPEVLYCTSPKAVNWLSFSEHPEPQKSVLPTSFEGHTLMKRLRDAMSDDALLEPKMKKEHFEEGVDLPQDLQHRMCRRRTCSKSDVSEDDCFQELSHR